MNRPGAGWTVCFQRDDALRWARLRLSTSAATSRLRTISPGGPRPDEAAAAAERDLALRHPRHRVAQLVGRMADGLVELARGVVVAEEGVFLFLEGRGGPKRAIARVSSSIMGATP